MAMDATRFDDVLRSLVANRTRRGIVQSLASLVLGATFGLLRDPAESAAKKNGGNNGNKKKKKKDCPSCKKKKDGKCKQNKPDGTLCENGGACQGGSCIPPSPVVPPGPTCSDGIKNGNESAVDCGGTCKRCLNGQTCGSRNDCANALCTGGTCQSCALAGDCGVDTDGGMCACRDNLTIPGTRMCTKINCRTSGVTSCANCVDGEQCAPAGAGFECCRPCGA
jgi:hypothetical protein